MGIGKRIKEARIALGITQEELAKIIGVTKGAIANYENETSHPKEPILYKMFEALQVDANYLFQDVVNIPQQKNDVTLAEFDHIKKYRLLADPDRELIDRQIERQVELMEQLKDAQKKKPAFFVETTPRHMPTSTRSIPYYLDASAGNGIYQFADAGSSTISVPIDAKGADIADFVLKVNGHSMEPDYNDGEFVMVSQSQPVEIGDVGIFIINGSSYIKERGETELISRNPEFDNIPVHDYDSFFCAGKVVGKF